MMAGPGWPGVGESWYQAALFKLGPGWGTASFPSSVLPMSMTSDWTSIAGMETETGREAGSGSSLAASVEAVPIAVSGVGVSIRRSPRGRLVSRSWWATWSAMRAPRPRHRWFGWARLLGHQGGDAFVRPARTGDERKHASTTSPLRRIPDGHQ